MNKQVIVIGSGPAGLQLGYYLKKFEIDYVILESSDKISSFFRNLPRHRNLISINKVYNDITNTETLLRFDWNSLVSDKMIPKFTDFSKKYFPSADTMVEYLEEFQKVHQLNILLNTPVMKIKKIGEKFEVKTGNKDQDTFYAPIVVAAHGLSKPFSPNIEGIENALNYIDFEMDSEKFTNKKVYIIGKGNSAFETAKWLLDYTDITYLASPTPLRLATETHYVGSVRAINNLSFEAYQLKSNNFILNAETHIIKKNEKGGFTVNAGYGIENQDIDVDFVINAAGFQMDSSFYDDDIKPKMRCCTKLPLTDEIYQSLNVENLFFAGNLMHSCDYRKGTSGFVHGFRHNIYFLARILNQKINKKVIEASPIKFCSVEISQKLLDSATNSAGIFLQIRTLADCVLVKKNKDAFYYRELGRNYILSDKFSEDGDILIVMHMDYGSFYTSTTNTPRPVELVHSNLSAYLHPYFHVFRNIKGKIKEIGDWEIIEELNFAWNQKEFVEHTSKQLQNVLDKSETNMRKTQVTKIELDESTDYETILFKFIGYYNSMKPNGTNAFNYLKNLPFKFLFEVVNPKAKYSEGYGYVAELESDKTRWVFRIKKICLQTSLLHLEISPYSTSQSAGKIDYYVDFNESEKKNIIIKISYMSDIENSEIVEKMAKFNCFK